MFYSAQLLTNNGQGLKEHRENKSTPAALGACICTTAAFIPVYLHTRALLTYTHFLFESHNRHYENCLQLKDLPFYFGWAVPKDKND